MRFCTMAAAAVAMAGWQAGVPAADFTGPWVGAEAAWEDYGGGPDEGESWALNAGWDFAAGSDWVAGVGLRAVVSGVDETETTTSASAIATSRVQLEDQWNLSGRIGYRATPQVLVYGELGYERVHVNAVRTVRPLPGCVPASSCTPTRNDFSFDEDLWTAGLGIDWSVTDRVRLRGSYSYGDSTAFERNRLAVGLSYAF
jgi:outer membrane autotransporter protein